LFKDPTGHISCTDSNLPGDDQQDCLKTPPTFPPPRETRAGIPALIQEATLFDMLPFNLLDDDGNRVYDGSRVNGFGDTTYAFTSGHYGTFGYLHPGVDIPLSEGTELLALGTGTVHCGADSKQGACGQLSTSGGHGIGIKYDACSCIVWYVHAIEVTLNYGDPVEAGDVVGVVGADSRGYRHLHLEIRNPENNMVYNPIYFFQPDTWNSINLQYQPYRNSYANPETRIYAIMMSTGFDYWNWEGTYPFVFVR
ncbi:MAG: peptidoglycan DD-metalloendopeptidase family protein, partial [Anaerolineae bacterium]|nr:peptidoglycan DD-metalloendopeptidase family protein [Anaerolineae bacterium]